MRLESGIAAPTFRLKDVYGRLIDLEDYRSKKILIAFFRHAGCPFCNLRVHTLQKYRDELLGQGLEMIFFFESKESVLRRSTFHTEISPIPLISDSAKVWYDTYGLESSGYKSAVSHLTTFVQTTFRALQAKVPVHTMADGESI